MLGRCAYHGVFNAINSLLACQLGDEGEGESETKGAGIPV